MKEKKKFIVVELNVKNWIEALELENRTLHFHFIFIFITKKNHLIDLNK